jgi:uncharacterized protein (TIGR00251 family)
LGGTCGKNEKTRDKSWRTRKELTELAVREVDGGVVFTVKVVPGSSRTCVSGLLDGMVKIKISEAPERGKANWCLIEFLAKQLGVKRNAVSIISGPTNPIKKVRVLGGTAESLIERLNLNK